MDITDIYKVEASFSKLIERVEQGEEIVIGRAGKPIAKLVPFALPKEPRKPGNLDIWVAPDFDELPKEFAEAFGIPT